MARSDMTHISMWVDFGHQRDEVPEVVVRRLGLREPAVGLRLHRVDQVGELDRVLDEEDRDVVADQVPVALLRVELDGEAAHVARQVEGALAAGDGREPHERRGALAGPLEEVGPGEVGQRLRSSRSSRARRSRGRARRARGCARGRSGRSSRGSGSPRAAAGPRSPTRKVFWSSETGTPCWVVSTGPPAATWCVSPPAPTSVSLSFRDLPAMTSPSRTGVLTPAYPSRPASIRTILVVSRRRCRRPRLGGRPSDGPAPAAALHRRPAPAAGP